MPALYLRAVGTRQNSEGRRRTSLKGGNRGIRSGESGSATAYGDLNGGSASNLANKPLLGDDIAQKLGLKANVAELSLPQRPRIRVFPPLGQTYPYRL
jgi:hypothetical protein